MIIAGKNCGAFRTTQQETICIFAGSAHIIFSSEIGGGSSTSLIKAVKFEENVPVPDGKFQVPAGYTLQ